MKIHLLSFLLFLSTLSLKAQTLVHYWNFNTTTSEVAQLTANTSLVSGASLVHTPGTASGIQITSNTGQGFAGVNARSGDAAGAHLRLNNPYGAVLTFSLPTTGYQNVVAKYELRKSSTSAAESQLIEYTTNGTDYTTLTTVSTISDVTPALINLDFSSIPTSDNNPNFKIRITIVQGTGGTTGNHRFDNFTVDGDVFGADLTAPNVSFTPANGAFDLFPGLQPTITFSEDVRLINNDPLTNVPATDIIELRLGGSTGAIVPFSASISGRTVTITPTNDFDFEATYYLAVKANVVEDLSNNAITTVQSSSFTTIVTQTLFNTGDIAIVAYRMSATATDDGFAFVSFVNILQGTRITFTDAKFQDNTPNQCAGGIVWTAPSGGIAAGTVVQINLVTPSATIGSLSGSGFGLSSAGDQIIVYAGSNTSANHISALSSKAWTTGAYATCSGSDSKIPATLSNGSTAISFESASGSVSGNTANAYYNGPTTGTAASLKLEIFNSANWIGSAANTAPQTWPVFSFPGPPSVISAAVLNANQVRVVFSRSMNLASATNTANYTGISGLSAATMTDNGDLADTVVLSYSTFFNSGQSYTLTVQDITDATSLAMFAPYDFSFTYNTTIKFSSAYITVSEDAGTANIVFDVAFPAAATVNLVAKTSPYSTAAVADYNTAINQTITLTSSSSAQVTIPLTIVNDATEEQDEYLVLMLESPSGVTITGTNALTVFIKDNDRLAPVASKDIELEFVGRYAVDNPNDDEGLAEIVAYDPTTERLFTMSTGLGRFDIVDFANPESPAMISEISIAAYGSGITSISTKNGIVAVTVTGLNNEQENGSVLFFNTNGVYLDSVKVGALPDMVTFTPDGNYVLTSNEGQPNDAYTNDPEGSISIVDISSGVSSIDYTKVTTATFTSFNAQEATLIAGGVRKTKSTSTLAQDFEPEFITVSSDSKKAWVTLQENNAIAEVNLETKVIASVWGLGTKDCAAFGNGFDASDRSGEAIIANWPIKAFMMPDAVANFTVNNSTYLVMANEGDEKEYAGLNERTTVADVTLDPTVFPNAAILKQQHNLGRLRITNLNGNTDADAEYEELYMVGPRSFAIYNVNGTRVFESGDQIERITSQDPNTAAIFNADHESNTAKVRSRSKGPEPEGLTIAEVNDKVYAFVALERTGGLMVYDITNPAAPEFVDYATSRNASAYGGDNGPEGVLYISAQNSPDGNYYVITANEISGTLAIFKINNLPEPTSTKSSQTNTNSEVLAYPNPASNFVQLTRVVTGQVINTQGIVVAELKESNGFSVQGFSAGLYLIVDQEGNTTSLMVK